MKNFEKFYSFMLEYTEFFEETAIKEHEKMAALLSEDLSRIEKCLNEHQSTLKRTELYEIERQELQKELGLEDLTFRAIISMTSGEENQQLTKLYNRLKVAVNNVSHSNKTSLQIAETNMRMIEAMSPEGVTDAKCYNNNGVSSMRKNMGLLNRKI